MRLEILYAALNNYHTNNCRLGFDKCCFFVSYNPEITCVRYISNTYIPSCYFTNGLLHRCQHSWYLPYAITSTLPCSCKVKTNYRISKIKRIWSLKCVAIYILAIVRLKRIGIMTYLPGGKKYESAKTDYESLTNKF